MSAAAFAYLRDAVLQTIGITCVSFLVALLAGLPLGILIAREDRLARALSAFVAVVRAIPELVLAIVAVVAVGLGPLAGIVALGAHYAAVVAKLTAELLHSVRREPAEALRATGATSAAAYLVALVPPAWPGLVGFGAYAFESIVRAAVIVGVVGAGGLGADLIQALNLADYRAFSLLLLALVGLVVGVDAFSTRLRAGVSPRAIVPAFAAIVAVAAVSLTYGDAFQWNVVAGAPAHLAAFAAGALPPDFSGAVLVRAANGVLVSIGVALAGTALGVVLAVPFALASAAPVARGWMRGTGWRPWSWLPEIPARGALAVARATPPIALGLIGLTFVGLGPKAGIFALAIHTAGVLGKLLAESLEVAERGPAIALAATGATAASAIGVALIPSALPAMLTHALYRFEWNVRASTVLGMIGAGGLGQAIFESQQLMFYRPLLTYVLVAIVLVLAVDTLGARARTVFRLSTLTR